MSKTPDRIRQSRGAFTSALIAVDQLAEAMADSEAPNGEAAYQMHAGRARQALLDAVAALDGRPAALHLTPSSRPMPAKVAP